MNSNSKRKIAIIGQGVIGLTSAVRLLDRGYAVDIVSRDELQKTTSASAGAYWWPHKVYPQERVSRWSKESYDEFSNLKSNVKSGVSFQKHFRFCLDRDDSAYARNLVEDWKEIDGRQYGITCLEAFLVYLPVVEVPIFIPFLEDAVRSKGARIFIRELANPNELFPEYDLVVNCSGVWARQLVDDKKVFPIRGQAVRISSFSKIRESTRIYQKQDEFTLILPRSNDCVLGGTAQENDWSLEIREQDTQQILARCAAVVPAVAECEILGVMVGLRPGRDEVRLELETTAPSRPIVHNYGHGGGGFTLAWGCANEVLALADHYFGS